MKKYISIFVLAAALLNIVSCTPDKFMDAEDQSASRDEVIYLWAGKPVPEEDGMSKIIYHDSLGLSGKGAKGFTMDWEKNDTLYAIRWDVPEKRATDYIILTASETGEGHQMFFKGTAHGGLRISQLTGDEHFILVHGHFVLDPETDGGVIDFPTSEVTKAGYASHIHHGGVEDSQGGLTFRNQDGTLANLKKHEYMIADAYVRFQKVTVVGEGGESKLDTVAYLAGHTIGTFDTIPTTGAKTNPDENPTGVKMRSGHTLLRLTMFVPDDMFDEDIDYRLLAASLRTADNKSIFHRYFRLHPNTPNADDPTKWKVDWNDHADKESNIYFRANMPGTRRYNDINDPKDAEHFDQSKTVCVAGSDGHYVTLYFSLPSKPLAPDAVGNAEVTPSNLFVTIFTRTHAFRSIKSYSINAASMKPGKVVTLNVNYNNNYKTTKAVTDPNLGVTFAPGIVYAVKNDPADANWTYGIYENQGEYAGLDQQTDVLGDYFIFGSIDPRQVFHKHKVDGVWKDCKFWNKNWNQGDLTITLNGTQATPSGTTDVAALAVVDNINNVFSTMSRKEADRVWARILLEAQKGINRGYYYYDAKAHDIDILHHTAHQAKGAWKNLPEGDDRRQMSSSAGIWIGIDHQPSLAEQDMYVFLPSSNQLNNSTNNMEGYEATLGYEDAEHYMYYASKEYGAQHVACIEQATYDTLSPTDKKKYVDIPTKHAKGDLHHWYLKSDLTTDYTAIMKFSTNTRKNMGGSPVCCDRFQVWYQSGNSFHLNSGIKSMDQTFGRVVRPVIY